MIPSSYLAAFYEVLTKVQITAHDGLALGVDDGLQAAVEMVLAARDLGRKVLLIGNGGSAAIVSHFHNDLCKAVGARALVFQDIPLLTALTNDDGYAVAYRNAIGLWADEGDLLIAVSSSGESENMIKATDIGSERGAKILTFTGFEPSNRLRQRGDLNVYVPDRTFGFVETAHSVLTHCISDLAIARVTTAKITRTTIPAV